MKLNYFKSCGREWRHTWALRVLSHASRCNCWVHLVSTVLWSSKYDDVDTGTGKIIKRIFEFTNFHLRYSERCLKHAFVNDLFFKVAWEIHDIGTRGQETLKKYYCYWNHLRRYSTIKVKMWKTVWNFLKFTTTFVSRWAQAIKREIAISEADGHLTKCYRLTMLRSRKLIHEQVNKISTTPPATDCFIACPYLNLSSLLHQSFFVRNPGI